MFRFLAAVSSLLTCSIAVSAFVHPVQAAGGAPEASSSATSVAAGSTAPGRSDSERAIYEFIESSAQARRILRHLEGGATETLDVRVHPPSEDGQGGRVEVSFSVDHVRLFSAGVQTDSESMTVTGESEGAPFSWHFTKLGADLYRSRFEFNDGEASFDSGAFSREDLRNICPRFRDFREAIAATGRTGPVRRLRSFMAGLENSAFLDVYVATALHGADGGLQPMGHIGEYLQCLKEACKDCSGCWSGSNCGGCPGDPWWAWGVITACYDFGADLCFFDLLSPIHVGEPGPF